MTRPPVVVALGSNLDDRLAALRSAVVALDALPDSRVTACSSVWESEPAGGLEQPDYLNAVILLDTALDTPDVLAAAHEVEAAHGRVRGERWASRTLDVDLIARGDETWDTPTLTLPHPRASERAFVLAPWLEVQPDAHMPGRGPVAEVSADCDGAVTRRPEPLCRNGR